MTTSDTATPLLIERRVTLMVSQDTTALWDAMARRLGLDEERAAQLMGAFRARRLAWEEREDAH